MTPTDRFLLRATLGCVALASALAAGAQQVYRLVGPDGRVTFTDRPPVEAAQRATPAPTVVMPSAGSPLASLPFALRNAASRFPVTLYTGADCVPCVGGRAFLLNRGIPFTERTVTTAEDVEALKRVSGGNRLPFLTIGGQPLQGFAEAEWAQYLDAAGYPRSSRLPPGWRHPAPAPLVAVQEAQPAPAAPEEPQRVEAAPAMPGAAPSNPAGIRF